MIKRKSLIWSLSKEDFTLLINNCASFTEALSYFDLKNKGNNFLSLKKRLLEDNIDFSHFKNNSDVKKSLSINEILVENSTYTNNFSLKKKLFKLSLLKNICYICGLSPEWNKIPLSLQLDHINGISNDHRIENLRILCPNCHSQTNNFAGKNKKIKKKVKIKKARKTKIIWPDLNTLLFMTEKYGFTLSGKKLGVSDNAIRKRIKKLSIT